MAVQSLTNPKVFISYATADRAVVKLIERHLREAGIEVWQDKTDLKPGDLFEEQIRNALNHCSHVLAICSAASRSSQFVNAELLAIEQRIKLSNSDSPVIIPVFLPGSNVTDLPEFIRQFQGLKLSESPNDYDVFIQRLLAAILRPSQESIAEITEEEINASNQEANKPLRTLKTLRLPDIDWVEIPAGPFIYGDTSAKQSLTLERFYISRYPITNCQYQTFIDAGGYNDARWWQGLIKPELQKPTWTQANRPRENVNWYEALAFTRWLTAQMAYAITLPTEQQWEKAARGTDGREYSWGNDFESGYANIDDPSAGEDNLQQTTAVGVFPQSQSPYQVMDMTGNVWEWCLNKLDRPEQTAPDQSDEERVARGGSWHNSPEKARAHVRYQHGPINRQYASLGFRVVCSSPFAETSKPEYSVSKISGNGKLTQEK